MKTTVKTLIALLFFLIEFAAISQEIDYSYATLSTTSCNVFASATDVANYEHLTALSRPKYADNSVFLECKNNNSSSILSTIYSIKYNFKANHNYKISVYYKGIKDVADGLYPSVGLKKSSSTNGGTSSGTNCVSPSAYSNTNAATFTTGISGSSYGWALNLLNVTVAQNFDYLLVGAFPEASALHTAYIYVRKIKIEETAPPASFTLSPSSKSISCGSTASETFTVTNVHGTTGVTNHTWNLGSASNGWLHNGSPAPQTIQTGTTNTLTLTPACGSVQQNVSAIVTANATNYSTNEFVISSTVPALSLGGNDVLCSGTDTYTISGLPCGSIVSWSSSDPAIATVTTSGNPATVTKVGNGLITVQATVSTCGAQIILTKTIAVGTLQAPEKLYFNGFTFPGTSCLGGEEDYEVAVHNPVPGASYWWSVTGAGDFRFGQGDPDAGITTQPEPGAYMYVDVQPENGCGLGDVLSLAIQICDDGLRATEKTFVVSPNPATDMIAIQKNKNAVNEKTKKAIEKAVITEVRIFDNAGNLKKQVKYGNGTSSAQVSLAGLKQGIHYIEIKNGEIKERHQLIIQK